MNAQTTLRLLITLSLLPLAAPAAAQQASATPRSGDLVRLERLEATRVEGTLVKLDTDSVVLTVGANADQRIAVARDAITNMWVSTGKRRQTWRGLGLGLGIGAVFGGLLGAVTYEPCDETGFMSCFMVPVSAGQAALLGGAVGGFFGTIIGGVIGFSTKSHAWEPIGVPTSVGFAPTRDGAVAFSLKMQL